MSYLRGKIAALRDAAMRDSARRLGGGLTVAPMSAAEIAQAEAQRGPQTWTLRRWDAADTTRLNSAHWARAQGNTIDADLHDRLNNLRIRSQYEAANNPYVEGVIQTYSHDLVGPEGPTLSVESDSSAYNEEAEDLWADWFAMPDVLGEMSGADMMRLNARQEWTHGEWLEQEVTGASNGVTLRMLAIDPERLATPPEMTGDPNVIMGVHKNAQGAPLRYWIEKQRRFGPFSLGTSEFNPIPADFIFHGFDRLEPSQSRGVPRLATQLDTIAELRDYDTQVLDAARAAADSGLWFQMEHPEAVGAEPIVVNETTELKRRQQSFLPPGYTAFQMKSEQPATGYVEYRRVRLAELGRPVCMPLMIILLSSEEMNFSSARFDAQMYQRFLFCRQSWYERVKLNRQFFQVAQEARRLGLLRPAPKRVKLVWTWWRLPHVDPKKEADAEKIRIVEAGTSTVSDGLAERGRSLESHLATLKKEVAEYQAAGLVHPSERAALQQQNGGDNEDDDDAGGDEPRRRNRSRNNARRARRELAHA